LISRNLAESVVRSIKLILGKDVTTTNVILEIIHHTRPWLGIQNGSSRCAG
jgi:hypothetical protein